MPAMFMFDSFRLFLLFGSIIPNIFEIKSLPFGFFFGSRKAASAQKEKKSFTCVSIAAAASEIIMAARILSISPDTMAMES